VLLVELVDQLSLLLDDLLGVLRNMLELAASISLGKAEITSCLGTLVSFSHSRILMLMIHFESTVAVVGYKA